MMPLRKYLPIALVWFSTSLAVAADANVAVRPLLTNAVANGDSLSFSVGGNQVVVQICQPNLVKVSVVKDGQKATDTPSIWKKSWSEVPVAFDLQSNPLVLRTDKMVIKVHQASGRVSVYDPSGNLLIKEHDEEGVYQSWQKGVRFTTRPGSHFYGIKGWEYLDDSRGQMEMKPSAQAYPIRAGAEGQTGGPLLWSNRGYGVFVNTDTGFCHVRSDTDVRFYDLSGGSVSYYVVVGSAYDVQQAVAELTGKPPMFPKWALGFSNSEFADMNEERCAKNVEGYRSRGIPIDLYTFDFQWKAWGEDHYGEERWNPVNFPNGPSGAFKKRMEAFGIKLGGIMKPRIHLATEQGRYAATHDFWVKERAPYKDYFSGKLTNDLDFSIPECRQWYWEHAIPAFDSGIVGWWNDEADAWGSTWEGMHMAQAMYEGQRSHAKGKVRVWTNNRNFFSGAQRYAYATWSGDIESGFGVMQQQRERLLCSVNVGQARWGMDTGGFNNSFHIQGEELNEAFARWMEFAAFVPIFRTHGTSYRQPWLYGPRAEAAAKRAARLRYSLIPYMYSFERKLDETGVGLVRPLVWDYPDDPHFTNCVDAWMFGDYLLVAPVVEQGQTVKDIYLPTGEWIDYFRGDRLQGGQVIRYPLDATNWLDIPLFVKKGAIIPSMEVQNYVGERPVNNVSLDVFPDSSPSTFVYYDDDGATYDYEKGSFFKQEIRAWADANGTSLDLGPRTGEYAPALQWYTFKIHGQICGSLTIDAKPARQLSTLQELEQTDDEGWAAATDVYGPAIYVKVRAGVVRKIGACKGGSLPATGDL
jgi:alpha-glucosidase